VLSRSPYNTWAGRAVLMAERHASAEARSELATDLTEMALCSVESMRAALLERFAAGAEASPA